MPFPSSALDEVCDRGEFLARKADARKIAVSCIGLIEEAGGKDEALRLPVPRGAVFLAGRLALLGSGGLGRRFEVALQGADAHVRLFRDATKQLLAFGGALRLPHDLKGVAHIVSPLVRTGKVVLRLCRVDAEIDERHRTVEARLIRRRALLLDDVVGVEPVGEGHDAHFEPFLLHDVEPAQIGLLPREIAVVADEDIVRIPLAKARLVFGERSAHARDDIGETRLRQRDGVHIALDHDERVEPARTPQLFDLVEIEEGAALVEEHRLARVLILGAVGLFEEAPAEGDDFVHLIDDGHDEPARERVVQAAVGLRTGAAFEAFLPRVAAV